MKKRVKRVQLGPAKLRAVWQIKPVTRVKESKKVYSRKGRHNEEE